ncbi:MAG: hypothetical protein ABJN39_09530 [Sulfitobacter sp.]|uniref:hypothetical protein n=1 Tax=Alphaproteobacteria TaxID=28211 RepID=UPI00294282A4|nr:hypothetical protein [Sulfitobacter sp. LC.270.F.C4]WOI13544.1 hypothetical protein R1T45_01930 [Sulfitobacter sp. LC.270.F.C4]
MTVDISSEAFDWKAAWYALDEEHRAQAERIKELEAQNAAGLRREKDANERAMQHLRRAEKAEIASKNHAAFSNEWRVKFETARNDALREALSHKWLCFHKCDEEIEVVNAEDIISLIEGATND